MLDSKKPTQHIKKSQNDVELKVHFLDETTHTFGVKVNNLKIFQDNTYNIFYKIDVCQVKSYR